MLVHPRVASAKPRLLRVVAALAVARGLVAAAPASARPSGPVSSATDPAPAPVTYNVYWGDLHGHTMDSPVAFTPALVDGYITYARDTQHLNFVALSEKDFDLTDANWSVCKSKATAYTNSSFVAFSAFEWGDKGFGSYGHRPVYYSTDDQPLFRSNVAGTDHVSELLDRVLTTSNGITSVAHPDLSAYATNWDYFDGTSDRTAEVYSRHGTFETGPRGLQQALARGDQFGFVAVSDTRVAQPGAYGLTAILSPSLTKSSLHAALKARRTYATTGARIVLRMTSDGHQMGEEYTASTGPTLTVTCTPASPVARIEVLKNNSVVYVYLPAGGSPLTPDTGGWKGGDAVPGTESWTKPAFDDAGWKPATLSGEIEAAAKRPRTVRLRATYTFDAAPWDGVLRTSLRGEYRIFLNGRCIVDTHTFGHDDPNEPHQCGGPDAFAIAGRPEWFRDLGFYDLRVLGARLARGRNVLALEYEPVSAREPAPSLSLETLAAEAPVSFVWGDNSFTGPSFYYVRVTQVDGQVAWGSPVWVNRTAPDTTPPLAVTKLHASRDVGDVYLEWPKVTKDVNGNFEIMNLYRVFRGTAPDFVPDRAGLSNQIATSTKPRYRDVGALDAPGNYYYRVVSVDAAGNESSAASNLAFKFRRSLPFHTDTSNIYWMSLPYQAVYSTADQLARDLNGGTSGACTKVVSWDVGTQRPVSWVYLGGQWAGSNFTLIPGQAVAVTLRQAFEAILVGAHEAGSTVRLTANFAGGSQNWVSVPLNSPHQLAYQVVQDINRGYFPSSVTRITRLNPDLQTAQTYGWNGSTWTGTNFILAPGEGYGVEVQTTTDWLPSTLP